jgi:predicted transcriptional regulator
MATLNMRLDDDLDRRLAREAEVAAQTRSELARAAIAAFLEQRERQRFLEDIARAARDRGGREALATAQEALATDNEALAIAEKAVRQPKATYRARRKRR